MLLQQRLLTQHAAVASSVRSTLRTSLTARYSVLATQQRSIQPQCRTTSSSATVPRTSFCSHIKNYPSLSYRLHTTAFSTTVASSSSSTTTAPSKYRVVLFASSDFSIPSLDALATSGLLHNNTCVVVTPTDKPTGRGRVIVESPLKRAAKRHGLEIVSLPLDIDFKMTNWSLPSELHSRIDVGLVVSFGYMLPHSLISLFPYGMLNIHPSLLPLYRGSSPIQFTLAHGDKQTGVSIIDVHPTQIDGGMIVSQEKTAIPHNATFATLSPQLASQGAQQLLDVLRRLIDARAASRTQTAINPSDKHALIRASAPRIPKSAGEMRWSSYSPQILYQVFQALYGFTPCFTHFGGMRIILHECVNPSDAAAILNKSETSSATSSTSTVDHFPSLTEASALGVGGLFFCPRLLALGVICSTASASSSSASIFYIRSLQLEGKPNAVDASTFARGYLDKRKAKVTEEMRKQWKFEEKKEEDDFWKGRLSD